MKLSRTQNKTTSLRRWAMGHRAPVLAPFAFALTIIFAGCLNLDLPATGDDSTTTGNIAAGQSGQTVFARDFSAADYEGAYFGPDLAPALAAQATYFVNGGQLYPLPTEPGETEGRLVPPDSIGVIPAKEKEQWEESVDMGFARLENREVLTGGDWQQGGYPGRLEMTFRLPDAEDSLTLCRAAGFLCLTITTTQLRLSLGAHTPAGTREVLTEENGETIYLEVLGTGEAGLEIAFGDNLMTSSSSIEPAAENELVWETSRGSQPGSVAFRVTVNGVDKLTGNTASIFSNNIYRSNRITMSWYQADSLTLSPSPNFLGISNTSHSPLAIYYETNPESGGDFPNDYPEIGFTRDGLAHQPFINGEILIDGIIGRADSKLKADPFDESTWRVWMYSRDYTATNSPDATGGFYDPPGLCFRRQFLPALNTTIELIRGGDGSLPSLASCDSDTGADCATDDDAISGWLKTTEYPTLKSQAETACAEGLEGEAPGQESGLANQAVQTLLEDYYTSLIGPGARGNHYYLRMDLASDDPPSILKLKLTR